MQKVQIMPSAGELFATTSSGSMSDQMFWYGSIDDLVHFVYGNQGTLFNEAAQVFDVCEGSEVELVIADEDELDQAMRVRGSWE